MLIYHECIPHLTARHICPDSDFIISLHSVDCVADNMRITHSYDCCFLHCSYAKYPRKYPSTSANAMIAIISMKPPRILPVPMARSHVHQLTPHELVKKAIKTNNPARMRRIAPKEIVVKIESSVIFVGVRLASLPVPGFI